MIQVSAVRDGRGALVALDVRGHAGFAERGRDIVCAAVSALVGTAVLGLRRIGAEFELEEAAGLTRIRLAEAGAGDAESQARRERAGDLLEAILLGLRAIAAEHGRHVRVAERGGGTDAGLRRFRPSALRPQEGRRQHPERARQPL